MSDGDQRYNPFQLVMSAFVKAVGKSHVHTNTTAIAIGSSPAVSVGFEVFLVWIESASAAFQAGAMRLNGEQGSGLGQSVDAEKLKVSFIEKMMLFCFLAESEAYEKQQRDE